MVKAIYFDFDGTLADSLPWYLRAYSQALNKLGIVLDDREISGTCFGKTEETICKNLGIPEKTDEFREFYFGNVKQVYDNVRLFPGVMETLRLAREKKVKLAIISFAYRWYLNDMVKKMDLKKYFDTTISYDDVKKAKPDPEAALLACRQLNVAPKDSVVIGDSKSDIAMGKAAGCQTILFYPEGYELFYDFNSQKQSNPDKIVKNFQEIISLL